MNLQQLKLSVPAGKYLVIKADGTKETFSWGQFKSERLSQMQEVYRQVGGDCSTVDVVRLRQGDLIMLVDDNGLQKELPPNQFATQLYQSVCRPEVRDECLIVGTAVVVHDEEF